MRILIDMGHPAHVHFFKNFIWEMEKRGHSVIITVRDKEVVTNLLEIYGFDYLKLSKMKKGKINLIIESLSRELRLLDIARKNKPDMMLGIGGTWIAHVSILTNIPSIIFTDYLLWYDRFITYPFVNIILTPSSFSENLGKKHIKMDGYKELAYLHPDFFHPDEQIFDLMGIKKGERFVLLRFASFDAAHDSTAFGFDSKTKIDLVNQLIKIVKIFIIPAGELPKELDQYKIQFPIEKVHDALFNADLLISDSQTMTTEGAVLGTPVIRYNSWVGPNDALNFIELERKYDLIYNFNKPEYVFTKCMDLLNNPDTKDNWKKKKNLLLNEKINVTNFLIWLVENFEKNKFNRMQDYYQKYLEESR
jgi:uncharacterized protein